MRSKEDNEPQFFAVCMYYTLSIGQVHPPCSSPAVYLVGLEVKMSFLLQALFQGQMGEQGDKWIRAQSLHQLAERRRVVRNWFIYRKAANI
jgi:hypothetical protein